MAERKGDVTNLKTALYTSVLVYNLTNICVGAFHNTSCCIAAQSCHLQAIYLTLLLLSVAEQPQYAEVEQHNALIPQRSAILYTPAACDKDPSVVAHI